MLTSVLLAAALRGGAPLPSPAPDGALSRPTVAVERRRVVVTIGGLYVEPAMHMDHHMMMGMTMGGSFVGMFAWPMDRSFHGLKLEILDAAGRPLPRRLLHHLNLLNFDRRQLVYPMIERTASFGQETGDMWAPATIGLPMTAGQRMGVNLMWDNQADTAIIGVTVRLTFELNPRRQYPAARAVLPFVADIFFNPSGENTVDIPPGGATRTFDFTLPVSGRLVGVGGHLHDGGRSIALLDLTSGRTIVTLRARADSAGHLTSVERRILALWRPGPHLVAGHQYRLAVRYDNAAPDTLRDVMGTIAGLFTPDRLADWPRIDPSNADYRADLVQIGAPSDLITRRD